MSNQTDLASQIDDIVSRIGTIKHEVYSPSLLIEDGHAKARIREFDDALTAACVAIRNAQTRLRELEKSDFGHPSSGFSVDEKGRKTGFWMNFK